jgi:hypothetical protein
VGPVGDVLATLFRYPDGIVTGNLIASAMCWAVALLHLERRHRQLVARLEHRGGQAAEDGGGP